MQDGLKGFTFNRLDKDTLEILRDKLKGTLTIREDQIWAEKEGSLLIIFTGIRALSNPDIKSVDCQVLAMIADKLGGKIERFSRSLAMEDEYCLAIKIPKNDLAGNCAKIVIAMNAALNKARLFDPTEVINKLKVEEGEKTFMAIFEGGNKSTENFKPADAGMGAQTQIKAG